MKFINKTTILMLALIFTNLPHNNTLLCINIADRPSITLQVNGGRLGNHLLTLAKAVYLAQKYNFRLLIPSFEHAEEFEFLHKEDCLEEKDYQKFDQVITLENEAHIKDTTNANILYVVPFRFYINLPLYAAQNKSYKKTLQKMISPMGALTTTSLPKDRKTIAIHIRTGGDYDTQHPWVFKRFAHKFTAANNYKQPLRKILNDLKDTPCHIHLFTDDCEPEKIINAFKKCVGRKKNVTFSYRAENNHHSLNILEDLFSMAQCHYLMRPYSTYSIIAQLIGNHEKVIEVLPPKRPISR